MENESEEINGQNFLPEILYEIFQYLKVQDLGKAAAVNKLWNEAAMREQRKRGLEMILISLSKNNVYGYVNVKPYVALIFVAPKMTRPTTKLLQIKVLDKYKDFAPHYLVAVGTNYVTMNRESIHCNDDLSEGGILSLLIPHYKDLKIRVAYTRHLFRTMYNLDFFENFFPEDSQSKVTFIVFGQGTFNNEEYFKFLQKCMEGRRQKYSIWGGAFGTAPVVAVNCQNDNNVTNEFTEKYMCKHDIEYNGMFAMSITGLSLESWSIVISCVAKKGEFNRKLLNFRNQLHYKRRSIGLVCGPERVVDYADENLSDMYTTFSEMMDAVKTIFPNVPFTGIYDDNRINRYYGLKSIADDPDQQIEHQMSLSLMILSFD